MAVTQLISGIVFCITIIGTLVRMQQFKLVFLILFSFGSKVVWPDISSVAFERMNGY